jgi:O-antigen/teichoic acid export membrane protein
LSIVGGAFSTVVLAQTTQVDARDSSALESSIRRLRRAAILLVGAGIAAIVAAPVAVPFLFGAPFGGAVLPAQILCAAAIVLNANLLLHEFARGLGHPGIGGAPEWFGLLVNIGALVLLLPRYGATGAAFASLLSYSIILAVLLAAILRRVPNARMELFVPRRADLAWMWRIGLTSVPGRESSAAPDGPAGP